MPQALQTRPAPQPAPPPREHREPVIATRGLTKRYGQRDAVMNLDIAVPRGTVAGFVGPNGSGKTTTIRMLLGLVAATGGTAEILGMSISTPREYLPRIGALIESPAFYPSLSGRRNLEVLAALGNIRRHRIAEMLELVGLTDRAADRVSGYSLGMKQRLGVAAALLPNPELLILDEPTNGLDPPGIIEVRDLLRRLRDEGRTVFVSSHLLSELEQVADWLIVLDQGRQLYVGPTRELLTRRQADLIVAPERQDQLEAVARIIEAMAHIVTPTEGRLRITGGSDLAGEVNRRCLAAGVTLVEIRGEAPSLEHTFLGMIGGEER